MPLLFMEMNYSVTEPTKSSGGTIKLHYISRYFWVVEEPFWLKQDIYGLPY